MNRSVFMLVATGFFLCRIAPANAGGQQPAVSLREAWQAGGEAWLQADFAQACERWRTVVDEEADSAEAVVAAGQLADLAEYLPGQGGELMRLAEQIEPSGWRAAESRRRIAQAVCRVAWREGRLEEARRAAQAAGSPGVWRIQRHYGHPRLLFDQLLAGKKLEGYQAPAAECSPCGWISLEAGRRPGLFTGQVEFSVPAQSRSGSYYLVLDSAAPLLLRLDGETLLVHDAHRRRLARQRRFLLDLPAGSHRLEFAAAVEEEEELGLWLAALPAAERSRELAGKGSRAGAAWSSLRELVLEPAGGDRLAAWLLRAVLAQQEGRSDRAIIWLRELERAGYRPELVDFLLSLALLDYLAPTPELARLRAARHLERIADKRPLAAFMLARLLQETEGELLEAIAWLRRAQQAAPRVYLWHWLEGRILERAGFDAEALQAYRQALELEPAATAVAAELFRMAQSRKDVALADLVAGLLSRAGGQGEIIGFYRGRGESLRAAELLRSRIAACSQQAQWHLELADLLLEQKQTAGARELALRAVDTLGDDRTQLRRALDFLDLLGEEKAAAGVRERLLFLYPENVQVQLLAAVHRGQRQLRLPGEQMADTVGLLVEAGKRPPAPAVAAERILDQATVQFFPDGQQLMRVHLLVRVNNQEGVAKWGEIETPGENTLVEALRTIKADGRVFEAEHLSGKETVSLPQLAVGDFVEVKLLAGHSRPALVPAGRGWVYGPWYFASQEENIWLSRLVLAFPPDQPWQVDRVGEAPEPRVELQSGWRLLGFEARDLPALVLDNHAPPADEVFPSIQAATAGWEQVRWLYAEELALAAQADDLLRELAFRVSGGPLSGARGLERLFYWVQRNIRQRGEAADFSVSAAQVVARREGNRLVVLCALVAALGWECRPLLARPLSAPPLHPQVPRAGVFVTPVVAVNFDGYTVWLEPEQDYQPAGLLDERLLGQPALDLTPQPRQQPWIFLPSAQRGEAGHRIELELEIFPDGSLRGRGREIFQPLAAVKFRQALTSLPVASRRQIMQAGLAGSYSGSELESWSIDDLQQAHQPLVVNFGFRVPRALERTENGWLLRGEFFPYRLSEQYALGARRRFPLLISEPVRITSRVLIRLPAGWKTSLPAPLKIEATLSRFEYAARGRNGELEIEKRVEIRPGRISPADLERFREFLQRIGRLEAAALFFQSEQTGGQ